MAWSLTSCAAWLSTVTEPDQPTTRVVTLQEARASLDVLAMAQPIYAHGAFLNFLYRATSAEAHVVLAFEGRRPVGALAFMTLARPGVGSVVNSLPWYGSHGGCILDSARSDGNVIRRVL